MGRGLAAPSSLPPFTPLPDICNDIFTEWQQPYVNVFKLCDLETLKEFYRKGDVTEHMVRQRCAAGMAATPRLLHLSYHMSGICIVGGVSGCTAAVLRVNSCSNTQFDSCVVDSQGPPLLLPEVAVIAF